MRAPAMRRAAISKMANVAVMTATPNYPQGLNSSTPGPQSRLCRARLAEMVFVEKNRILRIWRPYHSVGQFFWSQHFGASCV
jgi:hypothetical protein